MKYLKKFENNEPKIGDYVLVKLYSSNAAAIDIEQAKEYANTHVGKLIGRSKMFDNDARVEYKDVPEHIRSYFGTDETKENSYYRTVGINQIVYFGSTPEEVELKMSANKYNL